ncbi:MAG TPA: hypothetical protein VKE40_24065 [Gemmataceae bacterium]|nr:hypothetical protein [Gemmataceae bacterium]
MNKVLLLNVIRLCLVEADNLLGAGQHERARELVHGLAEKIDEYQDYKKRVLALTEEATVGCV